MVVISAVTAAKIFGTNTTVIGGKTATIVTLEPISIYYVHNLPPLRFYIVTWLSSPSCNKTVSQLCY